VATVTDGRPGLRTERATGVRWILWAGHYQTGKALIVTRRAKSLVRKGERGASAPCLRGPSLTGQGVDIHKLTPSSQPILIKEVAVKNRGSKRAMCTTCTVRASKNNNHMMIRMMLRFPVKTGKFSIEH
jgi:hypothetical protein